MARDVALIQVHCMDAHSEASHAVRSVCACRLSLGRGGAFASAVRLSVAALWLVFAAPSGIAQAVSIDIATTAWAEALEHISCWHFKENPDGSFTISGPFEIDGISFDDITIKDRKIIDALEKSCAGGAGTGSGGGGSAGIEGLIGAGLTGGGGTGASSTGSGGGGGGGGSAGAGPGESPGDPAGETVPDTIIESGDIRATQPIVAVPGPIVGGGLVGLLVGLGTLIAFARNRLLQ